VLKALEAAEEVLYDVQRETKDSRGDTAATQDTGGSCS
jgi:hypothetical protein